jgi:hypothetical protein
MQIEYAVRPSVPTNPHGATIVASTPGATRERATLTWGAKATLPLPSVSVQMSCCKDDLNETKRDGEVTRITQQDNADNFIDVFRSNKLYLDAKHDDKCDPVSVAGGTDSFAPSAFETGGFEPTDDGSIKQCKTTWTLKNNTAAAGAA